MNYLAHAYLSFNEPEILVGNLISDFVKGKKKFDYSPGIQKGIVLHRSIDDFTDTHEATKEAKEIFRPAYRLYASAFMDVVYDHFLAIDKNEFTPESLLHFSENTYKLVEPFTPLLPDRFQQMFPYMKQQNWLSNYQYNWGIERSMAGLVRRATYISDSDTAFLLFEKNYEYLQACYGRFFPDIKKFVIAQLAIL